MLPEHSRNLRPHHEKMYCEQRTSSSPKEKQLLDFTSPLILIFNSHTVVSAVLKDGISGAQGSAVCYQPQSTPPQLSAEAWVSTGDLAPHSQEGERPQGIEWAALC